MAEAMTIKPAQSGGGLGTFERYLSVWVALCMVAGIGLGKLLPGAVAGLRAVEFGKGSQINAPMIIALAFLVQVVILDTPRDLTRSGTTLLVDGRSGAQNGRSACIRDPGCLQLGHHTATPRTEPD